MGWSRVGKGEVWLGRIDSKSKRVSRRGGMRCGRWNRRKDLSRLGYKGWDVVV